MCVLLCVCLSANMIPSLRQCMRMWVGITILSNDEQFWGESCSFSFTSFCHSVFPGNKSWVSPFSLEKRRRQTEKRKHASTPCRLWLPVFFCVSRTKDTRRLRLFSLSSHLSSRELFARRKHEPPTSLSLSFSVWLALLKQKLLADRKIA